MPRAPKKPAASKPKRNPPAGRTPAKKPVARRADFGAPIAGFIARQPPALRAIVVALDELVREVAPEAVPTIKWGMPHYTVGGAAPFAIGAHQAHVNLILWGPPAAFEDPDGRLAGEGKIGRHLKLTSLDGLPRDAVRGWLRTALALSQEKRKEGRPRASRPARSKTETKAVSCQIALLRGINVGRAKRVAMAELRTLVEELGYGDVRTLRNSGNVLFTAPRVKPAAAATRIEEAVATRLGVASRVFVIGADDLATAVEENPLADESRDPARLLVVFLADAADRRALAGIRPREPEALALGSRAAYVWCPDGVLACRTLADVQRALGDRMTTRNWATVLELHALASSRAPAATASPRPPRNR